jgi:hypothetical protein
MNDPLGMSEIYIRGDIASGQQSPSGNMNCARSRTRPE